MPTSEFVSEHRGWVIRKDDGTIVGEEFEGAAYCTVFNSEQDANDAIEAGRHIDVAIVPLDDAKAMAGWDHKLGHCPMNLTRLRDWCFQNGVHYYSAPPRTFSEATAIREAQSYGLGRLVVDNQAQDRRAETCG